MEVAIGKRIAELREKRGLTLSQLAKLVGMSKSALWAIEQGKVSSHNLYSVENRQRLRRHIRRTCGTEFVRC
jgi:transcriptional regulator with XRE-family HTH domain